MKKSIRRQIVVAFLGFLLCALVLIVTMNRLFLEKFYLSNKADSLIDAYHEYVLNFDSVDEETLTKYCFVEGVSVVITYYDERKMTAVIEYTNLETVNAKQLASKLFGYMYGYEELGNEIIEKTDKYTILYNRDSIMKMKFMEMWGETDSGLQFIFRCPLEGIQDSVRISNRFYMTIGLLVATAGACFIWIFARRITKPIIELTDISQRMTNLDFEAKYTSGGKNEISVLGHNINQMSETLEKTIAELKTANNELKKDIEKKEQIDEMRKEFLANVSHELKTPIALIQGYAEGLQDNVNSDPESRAFYCEVIIDEADKMNQMVKKLLTLNQLEFGNDQVHMERFELCELIRGVIQSSMLLAEQAGAEILFRQSTPIYVWADEFKVEEVITNYLTNAIHHVKNEMKIDVRCILSDGQVKVIVFNTGDNIPEDELDKIWIKFYKVDKARTREYGGNGIGLSIVKAIMNSMNQSCGVKNFSNGVAFWFTLEAASKDWKE